MTLPAEQPNVGGDGAPAGRFLQLGKLEGRLVCSPDLDQLLSCACLPACDGFGVVAAADCSI